MFPWNKQYEANAKDVLAKQALNLFTALQIWDLSSQGEEMQSFTPICKCEAQTP